MTDNNSINENKSIMKIHISRKPFSQMNGVSIKSIVDLLKGLLCGKTIIGEKYMYHIPPFERPNVKWCKIEKFEAKGNIIKKSLYQSNFQHKFLDLLETKEIVFDNEYQVAEYMWKNTNKKRILN